MQKVLFPTTLALGFALACGGSTSSTTPPPPPPPTAAATDGSIGVPECDDYIKKMDSCMASMDPTMKSQYESAFKSTRDAWAQAAATPQGKEGLKMGCQSALSSMPPTCSGSATAAAPAGTAATVVPSPSGTTAVATAPATATTPATTATVATPAPAPAPASHPTEFRTNKKSPSLEEIRKAHH